MRSILATIALFLVSVPATPRPSQAQRLVLQGGPVVIQLDPVGAPVAEDLSARLRWNRVRSPSKIMVGATDSEQRFDLFVDARDVHRGTPTGEVRLLAGAPAQDFVVDITEGGAGSCSLRYRAEVRADQGHGTELHSITYTITGL